MVLLTFFSAEDESLAFVVVRLVIASDAPLAPLKRPLKYLMTRILGFPPRTSRLNKAFGLVKSMIGFGFTSHSWLK